MTSVQPIRYRHLLRLAGPIVVANASVPLLGFVDTAVMGHAGQVASLGAIAIGSLVFNFLYWGLGFLRMGTTGFTAQAAGIQDHMEIRAILGRGWILSAALGLLLILLHRIIGPIAFRLLDTSPSVYSEASAYFNLRIFGAPASLALFVVFGHFVGRGQTVDLLRTQLLLNGLNIAFDLLFTINFKLGAAGIGIGTAIAEWIALGFAARIVVRRLQRERLAARTSPLETETDRRLPFWPWGRMTDKTAVRQTLTVNMDIMVRTLFLLFGFGWFTNRGAQFGDTTLAANHVLLQIIGASAYLLDGYAHAVESLVGKAMGAGKKQTFDQAVSVSTKLAGVSAILLAAATAFFGDVIISLLTDLTPVRTTATATLPFTAAYILVSFFAFQCDGIFIGATATRDMRNASVISFVVFFVLSLVTTPRWDNPGLWVSFIIYVLTRGSLWGSSFRRCGRKYQKTDDRLRNQWKSANERRFPGQVGRCESLGFQRFVGLFKPPSTWHVLCTRLTP